MTITKVFEFEACHHLPYYKGACHNLHGHSYKLEVTVTGDVQQHGEKAGMIMDFSDLKALVKEVIIDRVDHKDLNTIFHNPTAENMASSFGRTLILALPKNVYLTEIKLWETSTSFVTVNYTPNTNLKLRGLYID